MATDYLARQQAKKSRKNSGNKEHRKRNKNTPKKICRGVCYQPPVLTEEDLEGRPSPRVPAEGSQPDGATKKKADAKSSEKSEPTNTKSAKRAKQVSAENDDDAPKKRQRLSTSIGVSAPRAAASARRARVAPEDVAAEGLPETIKKYMALHGLVAPTTVQAAAWPPLLNGKDVVAIAEPGAGKTLAYLLPAAQLLSTKSTDEAGVNIRKGPLALVLVPTRELAQQVAGVARTLRHVCGARAACIAGGVDPEKQAGALAKSPAIVVATPGRLLDLAESGAIDLGNVEYLVLDEADKMLGMGLEDQVLAIRARIDPGSSANSKKGPQICMASATMPTPLREAAAGWLRSPIWVGAGAGAGVAGNDMGLDAGEMNKDSANGIKKGPSINASIVQVVQVAAEHKKPAKLAKHLDAIRSATVGARNPPRILVFTNRIKTARFLHKRLAAAGWRVALLHGKRHQEERDRAAADFRSGKAQALVATDVAARGLHVSNLPFVVNYDFPPDLETYVHRVGRTGRLAADGHAFTFLTREMAPVAAPLLELLKEHGQAVDPNLVRLAEAYSVAAAKMAEGEESGEGAEDEEVVVEGEVEEGEEGPQGGKRPAIGAVLRELGLEPKKKTKKQGGKKVWEVAPPAEDDDEDKGEEASGSKGAAGVPDFLPTPGFVGIRLGYAFKKGPKGMGYYCDAKAAASKAQQQQSRPANKKEEKSKGSGSKQGAGSAAKGLLPGQLWKKKERGGGGAGDESSDGDGSGGEDRAVAAPRARRALPGRIRKKLKSAAG